MQMAADDRADELKATPWLDRLSLHPYRIPETLTGADAYDRLIAAPDAPGLAVVTATDDLVGFIDRQDLLARFARPIMREVYGGRPVTRLMVPLPLVVDADESLDRVNQRIAEAEGRTLGQGFVAVGDGRFLGVGAVIEVIRLYAAESRERARERDRARAHAEAALAELRQAQASLVQAEKLASLGGLVAGVAHEINTPVGIGLTAASNLEDITVGVRERAAAGVLRRSELTAYLDTVAETGKLLVTHMRRAAELVQSFKQVAVDRTRADRRVFALKPFLDEVLISLGPAMKKTPVQIEIDCPDAIEMDSYPGALSQVLTNLVVNSLTHAFLPDQTGTLTLTASQTDQDVILCYGDDGAGIPAEHLGRIFEPFFTTRRGRGGTGLGLHVVHNLVSGPLGGTISVASAPGQGTRFTLRLPRMVA